MQFLIQNLDENIITDFGCKKASFERTFNREKFMATWEFDPLLLAAQMNHLNVVKLLVPLIPNSEMFYRPLKFDVLYFSSATKGYQNIAEYVDQYHYKCTGRFISDTSWA